MDAVLTYVNGLDPIWQKEYEDFTHVPIMDKRFRDWGTLKYLLRGIEYMIPSIRNVYLVVSHPSQVPEWANTEQLKIVLHKDIIPAEFLPTFNSTTIEMFLHKIKGLDEEYLYFNDDVIPVKACQETDFFRDGKIVLGFSPHFLALDMYKKQCLNSDRLAQKLLGRKAFLQFIRPQHTCTPMLRSECEQVAQEGEKEIRASISALRENKNLNQYVFLDYLYYKGKAINERQSKKHFSVAVAKPQTISCFLQNPTHQIVCINDVNISRSQFETMSQALLSSFEKLFPEKSRFEL